MTDDLYKALLQRFCEETGMPSGTGLPEGRQLLVDNLPVALLPRHDADQLEIAVDLGPAPDDDELGCFRRLLEMNAVAAATRIGQIWLDDAGHVAFSGSMPVSVSTTGAEITACLDEVVAYAQYVHRIAFQLSPIASA